MRRLTRDATRVGNRPAGGREVTMGRMWTNVVIGLMVALLAACDGGDSASAGDADAGATGETAGGAAAVRDLGPARSVLGYLYAECPWQAFPGAPELGEGCQLDVFLASAPVEGSVPDVCAGGEDGAAPFTSRCLLDELGVTIDPTAAVQVDGADGTTRVCTIDAKGDDPACADGPVFAVTAVAPAIADGVYELRTDRSLARESSSGFPSDPLTDDDYAPNDAGTTHVVRISDGGAAVAVATSCDTADGASGPRGVGPAGGISYNLNEGLMAGGRFLFWLAEDGSRQAEFTIYGSGVPIIQSDRGPLVPTTCP